VVPALPPDDGHRRRRADHGHLGADTPVRGRPPGTAL